MGVGEEGEGAFKIVHLPVPWHKKVVSQCPWVGMREGKGRKGLQFEGRGEERE